MKENENIMFLIGEVLGIIKLNIDNEEIKNELIDKVENISIIYMNEKLK